MRLYLCRSGQMVKGKSRQNPRKPSDLALFVRKTQKYSGSEPTLDA